MHTLIASRLHLSPLTGKDAPFIRALLNSEGWLAFIGDRNIRSEEDARMYIRSILENTQVQYWVVRSKRDDTPLGVVTFIKRNYLPWPDIGFAFLPQFAGRGYAYEAARAVLETMMEKEPSGHVLAITVAANKPSIRLLEKLGLQWEQELEQDGELLQVYGAAKDLLQNRFKHPGI